MKISPLRWAAIVGLIALVCGVAVAQVPGGNYARVSAAAKPAVLSRGGHSVVVVTVNIAPDFHINAAKPADPSLIATKLTMSKAPGFSFGAIAYPANKTVKESYSPKPMLVYTGAASIHVPVRAASGVKPGHYTLKGTLTYQGCNHSACYPPQNPTISVPITVK